MNCLMPTSENMENKDKKSVFIIVRETTDIKERLWILANKSGFNEISDFLRNEWRKWL